MDAGDEYLMSQPLLADMCFYKQGRNKPGQTHNIGELSDREKQLLHEKPVSDFFTLSLEAYFWLVVRKYIIIKYYERDPTNLTAIKSFLGRSQEESPSTQYVKNLVEVYNKNTYTTPQIEAYLEIREMLKRQRRIALSRPSPDEEIDDEARRRYMCIFFLFPTEGRDTASSSTGDALEGNRVSQEREAPTNLYDCC